LSVYQTLVVALVLPKLNYGNATLIGLPACQYDRFQSVLNAAARSVAGLRRSDHITDTLASFHWLRAPQRVQFPTRRRLRSATSGRLEVPQTHLKTAGDRAFSVAGPHLWNSLPDDIVNCQSLPAFRRKLKTHLFKQYTLILFFSFFFFTPVVVLRIFT
jgi:hypothetical protein